MNKLRIAVLIIVFLTFTLLGFTAARKIGSYVLVRPVAAARATTTVPALQNILLLHVDDLNDPDLISVWIVFTAQYDKTYISFKPLYPDPLNGFRQSPVRALFWLQGDGSLSAPFVKWLQDMKVEWGGYFLMDQQGLLQFNQKVTGQEFNLSALIPINQEQSRQVFQEEARMYQAFCDSLMTSTGAQTAGQGWPVSEQEHIQTDLNLETAIANWGQISAKQNPQCEVIGRP